SMDVSSALLGKEDAKGRRHLVQQDNGGRGKFGFRKGNWKLTRHPGRQARNTVVEKDLTNNKVPTYQLYDLSQDPGEKKNVIKANPKIAAELQAELESLVEAGRSRVE
ncbi:MAG: arylsulfatase A-like enzyme, partial [Akkermansiaceae bacterium]